MSLDIDESPDSAEPYFSPPWHGALTKDKHEALTDGRTEGAGEDAPGDAEWGPDTGATTAEYAITTLAACGFAALLVVILKSDPIRELVSSVITSALGLGG